MACAALNVFTDLVILILPIPIVWSLQLPKRQRLVLIGIFSLGGMLVNFVLQWTDLSSLMIRQVLFGHCFPTSYFPLYRQ